MLINIYKLKIFKTIVMYVIFYDGYSFVKGGIFLKSTPGGIFVNPTLACHGERFHYSTMAGYVTWGCVKEPIFVWLQCVRLLEKIFRQ